MEKRKLRPVLNGDFWMIGENPNLGELQGLNKNQKLNLKLPLQECVDHHIFKSEDGGWHLWGCIRGTAIGRLLYHWRSENITDSNWEMTGEIIRVDYGSGECVRDWLGQEWMQSPFVINVNDTYYMFYGGHSTGYDKDGKFIDNQNNNLRERDVDCQICLMTSKDGHNWQRYRNEKKQSAVFTGPGETRDPCLIKIKGVWHMYYTGHTIENGKEVPTFYVRTSNDLYNWSDYKKMHYDTSGMFGPGLWDTECPHIVYREGYYYLFRTQEYADAITHVFRSENPYDFGLKDASKHYIGTIAVGAPEIIIGANGDEYISSNHNLTGGTMLCRLKWIDD